MNIVILLSCTVIMYNDRLSSWLVAKLGSLGRVDEDLQYALNEILLADEPFSTTEIASQVDRIQHQFSGDSALDLLRALNDTQEPFKFVRSIAMKANAK